MSSTFTEMPGTELAAGGSPASCQTKMSHEQNATLGGRSEDALTLDTETAAQGSRSGRCRCRSYTAIDAKGSSESSRCTSSRHGNGRTVAEDAVSGSEESIRDGSRAGADLRTGLGVYPLQPDDANRVRASLPVNNAAAKAYSEGMTKMWAFHFVGARGDLTKALKADPNYPLAHAAFPMSSRISDLQRVSRGEARCRSIEVFAPGATNADFRPIRQGDPDWPSEMNIYNSLFGMRPDRLDYGFNSNRTVSRNSPEVETTLNTLRQLPAPANDDARIDLLEASAEVASICQARRGRCEASDRERNGIGSPLLVARGYGILCQQGTILGSAIDEPVGHRDKAIQGYAAAGDRYDDAHSKRFGGGLLFARRFCAGWGSLARRGERIQQAYEREGAAATHNNLGDVLMLQGHLVEARRR